MPTVTSLLRASAPVAPRLVARPRSWPTSPADIGLVLIAAGIVVAGMWVRHGGVDLLSSPGGLATGLGQVTALLTIGSCVLRGISAG